MAVPGVKAAMAQLAPYPLPVAMAVWAALAAKYCSSVEFRPTPPVRSTQAAAQAELAVPMAARGVLADWAVSSSPPLLAGASRPQSTGAAERGGPAARGTKSGGGPGGGGGRPGP